MPSLQDVVAATSSSLLRLVSYIFLRWIPGHHFPPLVAALAVTYVLGFLYSLQSTSPFKVVADIIEIVTQPHDSIDDSSDNRGAKELEPEAGESVEDMNVRETLVLEEVKPQYLKTLILGLPSPTSLTWSVLTFLSNMALLAMVLDLTYRATLLHPAHDLSFARIGYTSDTTAKILVREPDTKQLPILLSYRHAESPFESRSARGYYDSSWKANGKISWLSEETDYTTTLTIHGLVPDTRYQYALSNNITGYFVTAPSIGQFSDRAIDSHKFTFLHTSCVKANFPYNPFAHPLSIPGFRILAAWLPTLRPAFMLFLGDFIYVDVPKRHGASVKSYRQEYRQVYASPNWAHVTSTKGASPRSFSDTDFEIPWIHTWDDHEIANDWDANTTGLYPAAFDPYTHYHISVNPPAVRSLISTSSAETKNTYFSFIHGPASFFMLDTRRFRTPSLPLPASDPSKTMLGGTQLADLLSWLAEPEPEGVRWKILISSVPFTKNWRINAQDTWAGYLAERQIILEAMWSVGSHHGNDASIGVIILSGDRHEFAATAFPPPAASSSQWPQSATVHEFSASPLSMFYLPVPTYKQDDDEDVCLKYIPGGNSKFGAVEIRSVEGSGQSLLTYRLFVDGREVWSYVLGVA